VALKKPEKKRDAHEKSKRNKNQKTNPNYKMDPNYKMAQKGYCSETSPGIVTSQKANPELQVADVFGGGCSVGCAYPLDCGTHYPNYRYQGETLGPCLFQPPFATSQLTSDVCSTCEQVFQGASVTIPQKVEFAAGPNKQKGSTGCQ